jgi:hypothetical protein
MMEAALAKTGTARFHLRDRPETMLSAKVDKKVCKELLIVMFISMVPS